MTVLDDSFYKKLPTMQLKIEFEQCHKELKKPERKLVLQAVNCKNQTVEDLSIDSFIAGFRLAMLLSQELKICMNKSPLFQQSFFVE